MPSKDELTGPPSETHAQRPPRHRAEIVSPYDSDVEEVSAQDYDRDRYEREERRDRHRVGDPPLDYGEGEEPRCRPQPQPQPRGRSLSPPRPRRRSRDRDYSRDRPRGGQRDRRSPSRRRDQNERRPNRAYSDERGQRRNGRTSRSRSPGPQRAPAPLPPPPSPLASPPPLPPAPPTRSTGYTIISNRTGDVTIYRPEYGQTRGSYTDLTKEYFTSDVVSVRLCDFSSDSQAIVGKYSTPSPQGLINLKQNVPFIFKRVDCDYGIGYVAHSFGGRGLNRADWIPKLEHAKYLGMANEDDLYGFQGNGSPHQQLKVRRAPGSRYLLNISHVFVGELVKVTFPRKPYYWGRLRLRDYYRLQCLSDFLTASPGSSAADIDDIPTRIGLDIGALKELRSADDSLDRNMKAGLVALDAIHKRKPSDNDKDADARPPRAQTAPNGRVPPPTTRPGAKDASSTAPPPATTQTTGEATRPRDQPRQPSATTANATGDPRLQPPTELRTMRPRDDDTHSLPNAHRRRNS
ncbi:hypothetical protein BKA58DRAFT_223124 [Alternaria rosae]|uniref:uncharacterized protein n=1 Tax=Alternaria rosae TaxID=1187941 RepID=UPI001E8E496E|nr:uncharacterized protein BKA58DRAFT_223124 [Alternaria rosae]KAH6865536.1 hypothetical protein BKA58DRAFT_223124 [Alternaria rosae]